MWNEDLAHCPGDDKSWSRFACLGERLADLLIELDGEGHAAAAFHVAAKEVASSAGQMVRTGNDVGRRQPAARCQELGRDSGREGEAFRSELRNGEWNLEDDVQLRLSRIALGQQELSGDIH